MNKKLLIGLIGILLVVTATALSFSSKQEAINYLKTFVENQKTEIDKDLTTITYLTDKECTMDSLSFILECSVYVDYTYKKEVFSTLIHLDKGTTIEEDDIEVRKQVIELIRDKEPIEEATYTTNKLKGRIIVIKK